MHRERETHTHTHTHTHRRVDVSGVLPIQYMYTQFTSSRSLTLVSTSGGSRDSGRTGGSLGGGGGLSASSVASRVGRPLKEVSTCESAGAAGSNTGTVMPPTPMGTDRFEAVVEELSDKRVLAGLDERVSFDFLSFFSGFIFACLTRGDTPEPASSFFPDLLGVLNKAACLAFFSFWLHVEYAAVREFGAAQLQGHSPSKDFLMAHVLFELWFLLLLQYKISLSTIVT